MNIFQPPTPKDIKVTFLNSTQTLCLKNKTIPVIQSGPDAMLPLVILARVEYSPEKDTVLEGMEIRFLACCTTMSQMEFINNTQNFDYTGADGAIGEEWVPQIQNEEIFFSQNYTFPLPGLDYHHHHSNINSNSSISSSKSAAKRPIPKGTYSTLIQIPVDPTWPSSAHHARYGMKYSITVKPMILDKYKKVVPQSKLLQEVWVLNSTIPPTGLVPCPLAVKVTWKKGTLPITFSVPNSKMILGGVTPMTLEIHPFLQGSKQFGQPALVSNAKFTLVETRHIRAELKPDVDMGEELTPNSVEKVMNIVLKDGWPKDSEGWKRTVNLTLPKAPEVTPAFKSKYLDVNHELVLTVKMKGAGMFGSSEEFKVQMPVEIFVPRLGAAAPSAATLPLAKEV